MAAEKQQQAQSPKPQPPQSQSRQPGRTEKMRPKPEDHARAYQAAGKLKGKAALISGGDSGIGRATAIAFAKEGADVAILYLEEREDAAETKRQIEAEGRRCVAVAGDIGDESFCKNAVKRVIEEFGQIDVLVNNAAEQHEAEDLTEITAQQLERTFRTNVFGMFFLTKAALPHLPEGGAIVNTTSITAYRGNKTLIDYSSTKGAIVSFTRSLSQSLKERKIRVNAVAPGPVWTPLIPASFDPDHVAEFGASTMHKRPAQPDEIAPSFVFLACDDSLFMSGEVLHPNGGEFVTS
jgi:NAD(P)-dependent dehydrogenase (short-subunit alcohol dehydrogenase family)